jgi:hypothetical protein
MLGVHANAAGLYKASRVMETIIRDANKWRIGSLFMFASRWPVIEAD